MKMNHKLVSVIVPIYNAEENLHQCVQSILNQSHVHVEVILINDGSRDRSGDICDELARIDQRVKVRHQLNAGPSIARNCGIDSATGDYIQFVDADDFPSQDMTTRLVQTCQSDAQLAICGYQSIRRDQSVVSINIPHLAGTFHRDDLLANFAELYKRTIISPIWNKIYRTEIIKTKQIYFNNDLNLGEDLLFNLRYLKECQNIAITKDKLYNYKVENNQSLSQTYHPDFFQKQLLLAEHVKQFLIEERAYTTKNADILSTIHSHSIINSLDNLFHETSPLTKEQQKQQIAHILASSFTKGINFQGSRQARLIGYFIKNNLPQTLFSYLYIKNRLKTNMKPIYSFLRAFNRKD